MSESDQLSNGLEDLADDTKMDLDEELIAPDVVQNQEQPMPDLSQDALLEFGLLEQGGESTKERSLKEFLNSMDDYAPVIPDAVTDFYLAKAGFDTTDRRIKRLLALATQKFVSDIASDAYQYSRIRSSSSVAASSNPQARAKALQPGATGQSVPSQNAKLVLTMEDLGNALTEYGLNIKRPEFYR